MKKKYKLDNIPVYEIIIDDTEVTGIRNVSLVQDPAIEMMGMYFADINKPPCHDNCNCEIVGGEWMVHEIDGFPCDYCLEQKQKFDKQFRNQKFATIKDQQMIVGPALIPNKKIVRLDENGDPYYVLFSAETIRKMVKKFNSNGSNRRINLNHTNQMVEAYIEQNWIVSDPIYDKSKFYGFELVVDTWFIEVHIDDETFWNEFVKGDGYYGFSVEGLMGEKLIQMCVEKTIDQLIDELNIEDIVRIFKKV